jgi:hypothetical protein
VHAGCVALLAAATAAQAQEVTWNGTLGSATGSYIFTEQFRTFSLLNSLTLRAGRLELSASLPVVAQNGTAISYVAGVPVPTGGPDNVAVARRQRGQSVAVRPGRRGSGGMQLTDTALGNVLGQGTGADSASVAGTGDFATNVGDPMFGASLTAFEGTGLLRSVGVEGWAKSPVASVASGIGTGAWDYGAGASLVMGLGETLVFTSATWWMLGDMPDLELKDALFYSMGVGHRLGGAWSLLATASASTAIVAGSDPPASLGLLLSRSVGGGGSISIGAGAGVTESASAFTASLGWSTRLLGGRD